ncbi:hypothetical protein LVB87_06695 [Lysobacter sp. KIS68-7]|uniref:hypothetical protein n=1 Tax=Lysobacter sp. KIS68-7 TaxID=2904252 RepID=UPI001E349814|nr:hypothetical protein [Lysobacter sp. KIS68-7]UHQ20823.1 hypothetical protein LVB87_06695 [Lysobacter sp. KIS68-7]
MFAAAMLCAVSSKAQAANAVPDLHGKAIALATREPAWMVNPSYRTVAGGGRVTTYMTGVFSESNVFNPTQTVRDNLAAQLRDVYGAILLPPDVEPTKYKWRTKPIAKAHPDADYVLDVFNGLWIYTKYPDDDRHAMSAIFFGVRLIDVRTGKAVVDLGCHGSTEDKYARPTPAQMLDNDGQLARDFAMFIAWDCVSVLAADFGMPVQALPAKPDRYVTNPLTFLLPERLRAPPTTAEPVEATK